MDEQENDTHPQSPTPHGPIDWLKYTNTLGKPTSWLPDDRHPDPDPLTDNQDTNQQGKTIQPAQPLQPAQSAQPTTPQPPLAQNAPTTSDAAASPLTAATPTNSATFHTAPTLPITPLQPSPAQPTTPQRRQTILWIALAVLILLALYTFLQFNSALHIALWPTSPAYNNNNPGSTNNGPPPPAVKSLQLAPNTLVIIDGHTSNITVSPSTTSTLTITARNHNTNLGPDNATTMHYDQSTNPQGIPQLHIFSDPADKDIDYDISAPSSTMLQINTDSGAVSVNGINATTIHTTNGGIDLANISGPINATTVSGNINAHDIKGTVAIQTTNGSINLNNITGQLNATTTSGDVIASQLSLNGHSSLRTTNGSVRFTGSLNPHGTYIMATNSGDIDLSIPATSAFQLIASTGSGTIHNDFNSTTVGNPPRATLTITVGNGSINIDQTP